MPRLLVIVRRWSGALVILAAVIFTLYAGSGWPLHEWPDFPRSGAPAAQKATFNLYSPVARTMALRVKLRVVSEVNFQAASHDAPLTLHASVKQGPWSNGSDNTSTTSPSAADGLLAAGVSVELKAGTNVVALRLHRGDSEGFDALFNVESLTVSQGLITIGNLHFCFALAALAAASLLGARALAGAGVHEWCAGPLIGYLIITASATLLSPFHLLTANGWTVATLGASALIAGVSLRWRPAEGVPTLPAIRPLEIGATLALTLPTFIDQIVSSLKKWDDLMYHGPRAAYWAQNASAFPFPAHNDRLSVFPLGGDAIFAWGTILSGSELPGKLMVFLALPLCLFALLALLKSAGVRTPAALGIVAVCATTPLITANAVGIKPDLWLVLFGIITLHWVLEARRKNPSTAPLIAICLAAAGVGAAFGIKWTAAPLILLAPLAMRKPWTHWRLSISAATATFIAALALGGAGPNLLSNLRTVHHPFASAEMRQIHQPQPGLHAPLVHLKRLPFILFSPPTLPTDAARETVLHWETAAAAWTGASEQLDGELPDRWPGVFAPTVEQPDNRFSLGWLVVAGGFLLAAWKWRSPSKLRTPTLIAAGLCAVFCAAILTQTRWQALAGLPDRFLLISYAFGLIAAGCAIDRSLRGEKSIALWCTLVVIHALPFCVTSSLAFGAAAKYGWQAPADAGTESEFSWISHLLPPGRTILFVGGESSREYPLFRAREGFANRVISWGKSGYDAATFGRAVNQSGVDTVIIAEPESIQRVWEDDLDARPFVQDMARRADFQRAPPAGLPVVFLKRR